MTKQELEQKLKELQQEHELKQKQLMRQYCDANNPYQIGDKFTDHIGSIIVEKIRYSYTVTGKPCCVYFGTELKKDGTPKKNNDKRNAWQSNDVSMSAWMSFDEYKKLNKLKSVFNSGYSNKVVIPKINKHFVGKKFVVMYDEEGDKINEGFEYARQEYLKYRQTRWVKRLMDFVRKKLHL